LAERVLAAMTDVIIAVSDSEAVLMRQHRFRPRIGIEVIPNGIDLAGNEPPVVDVRARLSIEQTTPLVGFVGRLARQKGPDIFIEAVRILAATNPSAHAVMIGGGPWTARTDRLIKRPELSGRLHRIPTLAHASTVLKQLDVLVQPSRWEGGPYVPLEAMLAGVPVVVTDVVGNRDTVVDGETGLVVPPEDPDALAAAMAMLLDDAEQRQQLRANARVRLAERFDVVEMGVAHARLYAQLVG
jgi:glycosyltransferase involved in cell wall biosynthesis